MITTASTRCALSSFLSGGPFQGPNDVIVDDIFARSDKHYSVGETIPILDHPFRISGIVEHGKGGRKYLPIRTLGALLGAENNASIIFVKSDDPKNEQLIEQEIHATPGLSEYKVQTLAESLSQMTPEHLPAFTDALYVVIGLAVVVGFIVIFQAMYTAVLERTREIGILKSLGASQWYIVGLVLRETAFLSIVGIVLGVGATLLLKKAMDIRFPSLPFPVDPHWIINATLIALAGALIGATYPALKAARKDPIEALAYEIAYGLDVRELNLSSHGMTERFVGTSARTAAMFQPSDCLELLLPVSIHPGLSV